MHAFWDQEHCLEGLLAGLLDAVLLQLLEPRPVLGQTTEETELLEHAAAATPRNGVRPDELDELEDHGDDAVEILPQRARMWTFTILSSDDVAMGPT